MTSYRHAETTLRRTSSDVIMAVNGLMGALMLACMITRGDCTNIVRKSTQKVEEKSLAAPWGPTCISNTLDPTLNQLG